MSARRSAPERELAPATVSEAEGVRYLHLGTPWVQGAMRIRKPHLLELEYIQRMMAWMLLRPSEELTHGRAVQLGLGAGAITRFCHSTMMMSCTAVELNREVIQACRMYFHLPPDSARFEMLNTDALDFVADGDRAGSAHALCVDLYDHEAAGPVLDSAEFYRDCHHLLAEGGVMSVNLFGRDASFERSTARIAAAFGEPQVRTLRPTKEGNTVVVALKSVDAVPERPLLAARADNIERRFSLPAKKWLRMIRPLPPGLTEAEPSRHPSA